MISSFTNSTTLTSSQSQALLALFKGKDIFLTGEAGTGKSYILELYIKTCRRAGPQVVALASSSTAALNLSSGTTMSRTLGISSKTSPGFGDDCFFDSPVLEVADVVVLDEISTCRVDLFDRFWAMIERAREKGGAGQVVVAGDFFQLPPIVHEGEQATLRRLYPTSKKFYAFGGEGWKAADFETCVLTEAVRQSDLDFIANLSLARKGDAGCIPFFNNRNVSRFDDVPDDAIRLVGTNRAANETNDACAESLVAAGASEQDFDAVVTKGLKSTDMCVPRRLRMVVGARVMLCADLPRLELKNGRLGAVTALHERSVSVLFDGRRESARIGEHTWKVEKTTVQQGVGFMAGGKSALRLRWSDRIHSCLLSWPLPSRFTRRKARRSVRASSTQRCLARACCAWRCHAARTAVGCLCIRVFERTILPTILRLACRAGRCPRLLNWLR